MNRKVKNFFKPNIVKISLAFICLGLTLYLIVPLFSMIKIVPCKIINPVADSGWCPVNPDPYASQMDTLYLGSVVGDYIYAILYFLIVMIVIPYTISCGIFRLYYSYIKKIVR